MSPGLITGFQNDDPQVNTVNVLIVVTSLLGPILTEVFAKRLAIDAPPSLQPSADSLQPSPLPVGEG